MASNVQGRRGEDGESVRRVESRRSRVESRIPAGGFRLSSRHSQQPNDPTTQRPNDPQTRSSPNNQGPCASALPRYAEAWCRAKVSRDRDPYVQPDGASHKPGGPSCANGAAALAEGRKAERDRRKCLKAGNGEVHAGTVGGGEG